MGAIYKSTWSASFSSSDSLEAAKEEWGNALNGISFEVMDKAIDSLKYSIYKTYPPNPFEFLDICKEILNKKKGSYPKTNLEDIGQLKPMTERTRDAFLKNIDKCSKKDRQDLCDILCKLMAMLEDKGTYQN